MRRRGRWKLAFSLKQLNSFLYHNSLAPGASVSPDIHLGHNSHGVMIHNNVSIGRRVKIWHNVTLIARSARGTQSEIIVEDGVSIGTNAVLIASPGRTLRVGRGARIGAGAVVTDDVPARATVVPAPVRILPRDPPGEQPSEASSTSPARSATAATTAPSERDGGQLPADGAVESARRQR